MPAPAIDHDGVRLTDGPAVDVVAVVLRSDADDRPVLDRAVAVAASHGARLVVVAPYLPATPRELSRAHREAPADVLADINPVAEVEARLHRAAARVLARGLRVTTVAAPGAGRRAVRRAALEQGADLLLGEVADDRPARATWGTRVTRSLGRGGRRAPARGDTGEASA